MTINSYSELLVQSQLLIDGEGAPASSGEVDQATLDAVISMAEDRVYRDLRSRYNQKAFSSTVTSNAITIPTDLMAVAKIWVGDRPLLAETEEFVRNYNANGARGETSYYAQAGGTIIFAPALTDGTAIGGRYYYKLPSLKTEFVNPVFKAYENLFLYAILLESQGFWTIQDSQKWAGLYAEALASIKYDEKNAIYNGSTLKVRAGARILR
jgi:hypothetical protein